MKVITVSHNCDVCRKAIKPFTRTKLVGVKPDGGIVRFDLCAKCSDSPREWLNPKAEEYKAVAKSVLEALTYGEDSNEHGL